MADMRSEGERESGNDSSPNFEKKMEEPQKAILAEDWGSFKRFFQNDQKAIMEPLDLYGNTAVHVAATRWNKPELMRELLDILPEDADRWRVLRKGNANKNTVLHQVIHCENVMMVDVVLDYGKHLQVPDDEEGEDKNLPLLELVNDKGETPVYRAAKYGKFEMLKHMAGFVDMRNHFYRRQRREDASPDRTSILHIAIIGQHFEVALWLTKVEGIDQVASTNDGNELSCLQVLSGMPSAFRSCDSDMGFTDKLIYACVPANVESYDDGTHHAQRQCIKRRTVNVTKIILALAFAAVAAVFFIVALQAGITLLIAILSITVQMPTVFAAVAALAILSFAAETFIRIPSILAALAIMLPVTTQILKEWDRLEKIGKKKRQHKLAEELADFLIERDSTWMHSKHAESRKEVVFPVNQFSNVATRKKARQANEEGQSENPISSKVYTALLLAASTGIEEIVKKTIDLHREAIFHVSHDEQNILHVTVKHRQQKIYKLLKKYGALESLAAQMSNKGCTLLHHAAMMDHYVGGNKAGVVFQLQEELRWFDRVNKITPSAFVLYRNNDKLTARELFELEHSHMLNEAQAWIKGTAQSCSAVAALIATVVFPVSYTVPGDYNDKGVPVLDDSFVFKFLIIMDALALMSSLLSVMMFLTILTSPFQMQEFKQRLPLKLSSGFAWMFFSLMATMLTFVSTILLTSGIEDPGFSTLIYSIMVFPFIIFGLTQHSFLVIVKYITKNLWKALKDIVPKRLIKSTKRTRERVYSKYP